MLPIICHLQRYNPENLLYQWSSNLWLVLGVFVTISLKMIDYGQNKNQWISTAQPAQTTDPLIPYGMAYVSLYSGVILSTPHANCLDSRCCNLEKLSLSSLRLSPVWNKAITDRADIKTITTSTIMETISSWMICQPYPYLEHHPTQ